MPYIQCISNGDTAVLHWATELWYSDFIQKFPISVLFIFQSKLFWNVWVTYSLDILLTSDIKRRHRSGSTLAQEMACCWWHEAITRTNVDLSPVKPSGNTPGSSFTRDTSAINYKTWWCHQMETFSALLALCEGGHRSPADSPYKGQ